MQWMPSHRNCPSVRRGRLYWQEFEIALPSPKAGTFTPVSRPLAALRLPCQLKGSGGGMDKKSLSERDICTKLITPAIRLAGWDIHKQVREEVSFTKGRIVVRGKLHSRGEAKRADYALYHQHSVPIAVIEAKDNKHSLGAGMRQAQGYADALDVPFVFSSNGDGCS